MMEMDSGDFRQALRFMPSTSGPTGLLLSRDLIFTCKVKGTAADLGHELIISGNDSEARSIIEVHKPRVVFIDLTATDMATPATLVAYQDLAGPTTWFVAFGPHVDVDALSMAKRAGCHVVLPRSRFSAELPAPMQRYFSQPARNEG